MTADSLALDRASVRTRDENGYLHVAVSNISKAAVNGYLGAEIPNYEKLGLEPQRLYQLLRDPEEIEKAAGTFNGVPILNRHIPVTAQKPPKENIIGAVGTDAEFKAPFLRNSLVFWEASAIAGIETGEQQELSSAYRYDADMTPGEYEGAKYDGVMRNLRANHVALVPDGRAGSDVVVGDSKPPLPFIQEQTMAKVILSHKAAYAKGALSLYLAPKLAQDAKLPFSDILKDVTAKNFKELKPKLIERITAATKDKMAQDASLDDLGQLLDVLGGTPDDGPADPANVAVGDTDPDVDPEMTGDDEGGEAVKAFLKEKLSPEDHAKVCALMGGGKPATPAVTGDEPPPFPGKPETGGKEEPLSKPAMDAAITAAVTAERDRAKAARDAERDVQQWVGSLSMAHDSAEGVYRAALGMLSVPNTDIKEVAALRAVLHAQPKPGARPNPAPMAQDANTVSDFAKRYPNAARITSI